MKLLIISQHFYPENFRINDIAFELGKYANVDVITGKPNYHTGKVKKKYKQYSYTISKKHNVKIHRLPIISRGKKSFVSFFLNYFSFIFSIFFFRKNFLKKNYDLIFIYATSPILQALPIVFLKKKFQCKVIIWIQDLWPESLIETGYVKNIYLISLVKNLVKYILSKSDYIFIQSYYFRKKILSFDHLFKKKIWVYENPSEDFTNVKIDFNTTHSNIIIYSGNIGFAQDVEVFLELAKSFKKNNDNFCIHVYGNGSQKDYLSKKILLNGLVKYIKLFNHIPPFKLYGKINKAKYLLITLKGSDAFSRTLPGKFQSYLNFGKPLLVMSKGILKEYTNKYSLGVHSNPGSYKIFYQKIIALSKDQKLINLYSSNCRNLFLKKYNLQLKVESLLIKFKEIINQ